MTLLTYDRTSQMLFQLPASSVKPLKWQLLNYYLLMTTAPPRKLWKLPQCNDIKKLSLKVRHNSVDFCINAHKNPGKSIYTFDAFVKNSDKYQLSLRIFLLICCNFLFDLRNKLLKLRASAENASACFILKTHYKGIRLKALPSIPQALCLNYPITKYQPSVY